MNRFKKLCAVSLLVPALIVEWNAYSAGGIAIIKSRSGKLYDAFIESVRANLKNDTMVFDLEGDVDFIDGIVEEIDVLLLLQDSTVLTAESIKYLIVYLTGKGVPVIGNSEAMLVSGAAVAIVPDEKELGKQAADLIKSALEGKGEDMAKVSGPGKFSLRKNQNILEKLLMIHPELEKIFVKKIK